MAVLAHVRRVLCGILVELNEGSSCNAACNAAQGLTRPIKRGPKFAQEIKVQRCEQLKKYP